MERPTKLKHSVTVLHYMVVIAEALALVAIVVSFATAEFSYMMLAVFNLAGAVVLAEILKALCRSDNDWHDAYVAIFQRPPLPGPLYRLVWAVLKRRRPQRGWLQL